MDNKRIIKPRKRYIEETEQQIIEKPKRKPKKQPKKQQQPEMEKPIENVVVINKKAYKDMYDPQNPYWIDHYYTPNDELNNEYIRLTDNYINYFAKLPPIFLDGIAQLEEKDEFKSPLKQIVSLKKLKDGEYETKGSKSDKKNISGLILFFVRNLPSFKKYKDVDDLSWVYNENRKLLLEILEYSFLRNSAITTIKSKINAMCRIIGLSLKTKNDYTYQKYAYLVAGIGLAQEDVDDANLLSELEIKKFIIFEFVILKQLDLERKFNDLSTQQQLSIEGFKLNQELLLVSLYCLIPPLRDEPKTLQFTTTKEEEGDWVWFRGNGDVVLLLNKDKKRHDGVEFNLSREDPFNLIDNRIVNILKQSYNLYPREPLFATIKNGIYKKKAVSTISQNLIKIFSDTFPNTNVGTSSLRSSYYSYKNQKAVELGFPLQYEVKKQIAFRMRTSIQQLDQNYLKLYHSPFKQLLNPINQEIQQQEIQPPIITKSNAYFKKLEKNKKYIENNKEKVYKQQKQYRDNIPKQDATRKRLLRLLNHDEEYRNHIRQATIDKYDFKLDKNNKYY